MKKIVYIPVEVKARELNGKLLLALELLKRGYIVFIGEASKVYAKAEEAANSGILMDKCFGSSSYPHWKKVRDQQGKVYSWDEESIVYMNKDYYLRQRVDKDSLMQTDGIIAWGEDQKDNLLSKYPELENRLVVLGNPRIDILNIKFRKLWEKQALNYRKKFGSYILVNYSLTTNFDEIKRVRNNFNRSRFITEEDRELFKGRLNWMQRYTEQFNAGIEHLAKKTAHTIIVRPHPGDNGENLKKQFESCGNIHVISQGNSNPWILGADVMIHQGSTSAVEAYIQNRCSILFAPVYKQEYYGQLAVDVSLVINNKEDLVRCVKKALLSERETFFTKEKEKALNYFIYQKEDEFAVERIADLIDKNCFSKGTYVGSTQMPLIEKIEISREILNRSLIQSKNELTGKREIKRILYQLDQAMHYNINYKIKNIDRNLFLLIPG